jgi:uncharacterized protein (TIGR00251 family)
MAIFKETKEGVILPIKVTPKSHRNEIIGWENEELKVRITAAPEKGNANETLLNFLAKLFKLPKSRLSLYAGETSRHKRICIQGIRSEDLEKLI